MLEPDPALVEVAEKHREATFLVRPIPSECQECSEKFPSRLKLQAHIREKHPKEPPFNDNKREEFLALLRAETGLYRAARQIGISPNTVKRAMQVDPTFGEAVTMAEEEAAENIEDKLREAAKAGDPWAVKEWLGKRQKSRWGDEKTINVNVSGQITYNAELLPHENTIASLTARINERRALSGGSDPSIIDAEIIDE